MKRLRTRFRMWLAALTAGLAVLQSPARAEDVWTITTADFLERRGAVSGIDADGVVYREPSGQSRVLPWTEVLELTRVSERGGVPGDVLAIYLLSGDCLTGSPVALADELLTWGSPLGEFKIPLSKIKAIARGELPFSGEPPQSDTITLSNGDVVAGVVDTLDGSQINVSGQNSTTVNWDLVQRVNFAGAQRTAPGGRALRISLVGGSVISGQQVKLAGERLEIIASDGTPRAMPLGSIESIEQIGGPVLWLTDLEPAAQVQQPYFSAESAPTRFNATPRGDSIRDGERLARCGIAMASYSRLTWKLDGSHVAFRGKFAIDGPLPYANVTVRIKLDDQIAYEKADVTGATPTQTVVVPLNHASQLALEVDYGKTYDVQDRLNWIEPALLKTIPSTQPSR